MRAKLLDQERDFAATPCGAVIEGRVIGTVVAPQVSVKICVSAEEAVRRAPLWRYADIQEVSYHDVLAALVAGDSRDNWRAVEPIKIAGDAVTIDISELSAETRAIKLVDTARGRLTRGAGPR